VFSAYTSSSEHCYWGERWGGLSNCEYGVQLEYPGDTEGYALGFDAKREDVRWR